MRKPILVAFFSVFQSIAPIMNPALSRLHPYPFEKLTALRMGLTPPAGLPLIDLSIGEPKHATPSLISEALIAHLHTTASYPTTRGTDALRKQIVTWLQQRFRLPADSLQADQHVLPVNGTREALFAIAQCLVDTSNDNGKGRPVVIMPNPFYQIYEGAALLAGAEPWYVPCPRDNAFLPDYSSVPDAIWDRCQLLYLCSPGNPTGAVMPPEMYESLLQQADRHGFVIAADECYSEIYADEGQPPLGLLQAAASLGRDDYRRCLVFHSLSKRSNAPGLRSGFVAGDAELLQDFLRYRTYHGCTMPLYTQSASSAAWADEAHVRENRALYREKFTAMVDILAPVLPVEAPPAGFYLWPETPVADTEFAAGLYASQNVSVLPGSFLGREVDGLNPGTRHVRIALVAPFEDCIEAGRRIVSHIESL